MLNTTPIISNNNNLFYSLVDDIESLPNEIYPDKDIIEVVSQEQQIVENYRYICFYTSKNTYIEVLLKDDIVRGITYKEKRKSNNLAFGYTYMEHRDNEKISNISFDSNGNLLSIHYKYNNKHHRTDNKPALYFYTTEHQLRKYYFENDIDITEVVEKRLKRTKILKGIK